MARDHRLDFSDYRPSMTPTFRPDRDRSRSPRRPRADSWRTSNSLEDYSARHSGGRGRGKSKPRTENEYRERTPNPLRDGNHPETGARTRKGKQDQSNDTQTKGLSNKIHSLRRLLEKATDMPADIRQEKERELQGYVADQQRNQARREKNAVTSRYHFVRFMERKKAERQLRRCEKNFDSAKMGTDSTRLPGISTGSRNGIDDGGAGDIEGGSQNQQVLSSAERLALSQEECRRQLHEAKVDLNYTLYAPLDQKYISLFPPTPRNEEFPANSRRRKNGRDHDAPANDDKAGILRNNSGQKPPLWNEVEKAMENDTLEALRDGKVLKADKDGNHPLRFRGIKSDSGEEDDEGEESDEDFFER
jgi:rRNA-processing protein Efg1